MENTYGQFEQLVQSVLRNAQLRSDGLLRFRTSPLKGDRRYYFLEGEGGTLEVACIPATDDAEWTFVNHGWIDQDPRWRQFRGYERNEAFLHSKVRELRVRLGLPWGEEG